MAIGLRAKLKAMGMASEAPKKEVRRSGLLCYMQRRDIEPGILDLSPAALRRMGWNGGPFDARKCLFLDTETTGLSGGAGTVAFLVGVGFLENGAFIIEQYLMQDYSDEPELIDRLANRMDGFEYVCTFNGKTFDMPLLEARFTMCRMRHRWREMDNLDLLQPARRTWKLRLGSCRLGRLEEMILGMGRTDDLPGSQVPERYFEFLKTGRLELLEDIIRHNQQDIATLATLLVKLNEVYEAPEALTDRKDQFSVGKTLEKQGEWKEAKAIYRASAVPAPSGTLAALTGERVAAMANWNIYRMERRSGNLDGMKEILEQMLSRGQMPFEVQVELSKFYEHRRKNLYKSRYHALEAMQICPQEEQPALEARLARIENKIAKQ